MNILLDKLPESVRFNGYEYPINADFRAGIRFEMLILDRTIKEEDKAIQALQIFYGDVPSDPGTALEAAIWFYRCGRDDETNSGIGSNDVPYSYEYDAGYIAAAFMEQYGVDLNSVEFLHWWKFKSMFDSISENTMFSKAIGYRTAKIDKNMSSEEKSRLKKLQRAFAIPRPKSEQDMMRELEEEWK
ncbi:bacteriophage Gp15 family protein [Eubacterium aggregans]|uniref:bacteriophage Gp15 family protein n=1 Tax=Eubacterium aggregans TaxID=81409 RepID=UPI003F34C06D